MKNRSSRSMPFLKFADLDSVREYFKPKIKNFNKYVIIKQIDIYYCFRNLQI